MISVSNLAKGYGDRTLFAGVSLQLNAGERYGLVGANGSGKTTLLNVLAGDLDATEGAVSIPKGLRLGVLRQDQFVYEDQEVLSVALMGNPDLWHAMVEKEQLLAAAEQGLDMERFGELEDTIQRNDGYAAESRAAEILEGLGLPALTHHQSLSTLSGGFKLRVLLAQVLASAPDVLLLDEPTNHLDILSIRWLETFLQEFAGPVVVISHDHRFLDNTATSILDVDYETVTLYPGDYTAFLEQKAAERERREKDIATQQREIAHHQKFVDRFRAKASKARQAQSKVRMIEKKASEIRELPVTSRRYPSFDFEQRRPSGREVLDVKGIKKAFGENRVLHGVDLQITRGDRVAILGPNGIGKSTLLKIVVGDLEADEGEVAWGYEAHPAYFAQDHREQLDSATRTAEDWLWDACPGKDVGWVRSRLGMMLFSGDDSKKRLSSLSGGEAARLVFSRIAVEKPNVLVLDEPTNHLDLESIEALVQALQAFAGTLILVSHDRWFVGQLATRIVEIRADGITDYPGTYEEYVHALGDDHLDVDEVILKARAEKRRASAADQDGLSPAERRRLAKGGGSRETSPDDALRKKLEKRQAELIAGIEAAEVRVTEIERLFCEPGYYDRTPLDEVRRLEDERARLSGEVAERTAEWERVVEEMEGV
jgi:ATPase subunit of ABC transporter with duplicated ATPase domains